MPSFGISVGGLGDGVGVASSADVREPGSVSPTTTKKKRVNAATNPVLRRAGFVRAMFLGWVICCADPTG